MYVRGYLQGSENGRVVTIESTVGYCSKGEGNERVKPGQNGGA